jgi:dienelactone hydrolase
MLLGGKDDYTPARFCLDYADLMRAEGASVTVVVYANAYHGFDSKAAPHFNPRPTTVRDCRGKIDLDAGVFTLEAGDQELSGKAAERALTQCTEHGVTVGGDAEAREKAPRDVADFLKPILAFSGR